jgi:hypothetical protein
LKDRWMVCARWTIRSEIVCAKRTISSEVILDAPNSTPRFWGSSESSFSVCLEIVQILTQDMCTVGAKSTIASETVFDASASTPRDVGHVESRLGPFGDSVCVSVR